LKVLPAALFAAGAVVIVITLALPWTVVDTPSGDARLFLGYQEDLLAVVSLALAFPTIRMLYVGWYETSARAFAALALVILLVGMTGSYIDIRADGLAHGRTPTFLAGYYLGWLPVGLFALGLAIAIFREED
jgi:hypothetical protein